jgi:hypothetical protein
MNAHRHVNLTRENVITLGQGCSGSASDQGMTPIASTSMHGVVSSMNIELRRVEELGNPPHSLR